MTEVKYTLDDGVLNVYEISEDPDERADHSVCWDDDYAITRVVFHPNAKPKYLNAWFADCENLVEVTNLPDSVEQMNNTFENCVSLREVSNIPKNVKCMEATFLGCESLVKVPELPEGVEELNETFKGCKSLTVAPRIPYSVLEMDGTFEDCISIKEPSSIPPRVFHNFGDYDFAYYGCPFYKRDWICQYVTTWVHQSLEYSIVDGVLTISKLENEVAPMDASCMPWFEQAKTIKEIVFGPDVKPISLDFWFWGFSALEKPPILPDSVETMYRTFCLCTTLEETPKIPPNVNFMTEAFAGCAALKCVEPIPTGVDDLSDIFLDCPLVADDDIQYCTEAQKLNSF